MRAKVVLLRKDGQPKRLPLIRSYGDIPRGESLAGVLAFERERETKRTGLLIRAPMSAPGCGALAMLFAPRITAVAGDHIIYAGMEMIGDAVHGQEWMVFIEGPDVSF